MGEIIQFRSRKQCNVIQSGISKSLVATLSSALLSIRYLSNQNPLLTEESSYSREHSNGFEQSVFCNFDDSYWTALSLIENVLREVIDDIANDRAK